MKLPRPAAAADDLFDGPGELRALARQVDWSATSLGPVGRWPQSLRVVVRLCLESKFPMSVWAGADLVLIYNDGYPGLLGAERHPWAFGRPAREVWAHLWGVLGPRAERVLGGESVAVHDERLILQRDGKEVESFFSYGFTPIREDDGTVVGAQNVFIEITERMLVERDLQRVFDLAPDPLTVMDVDGRYRRVNAAFHRLLGWSESELLGRHAGHFTHPDDREPALQALGKLLPEHPVTDLEVRHRHKDGSYRWLAWNVAAAPGERWIYAAARDITERKRAEQARQESEQRFQLLAEALPQLVWRADANGTVTYYNSQVQRFEGFERRADGTWVWQPVLHPDDVGPTSQAWSSSIASGEQYQIEHRTRMGDGSYRWHLSRAMPLRESDGTVQWFGTATDIHEVKLAQEALRESDQRKDEFLAMLGHELRNPLAAIRSATEVVRLVEVDDARLRRAAGVLERQSAQMARLIDGLLEVSRIARGKVKLDRRVVDVREVLDGLLEDQAGAIAASGLSVTRALSAEPLWVLADEVRLIQVFDNLLGNALKFTAAGGAIGIDAGLEGQRVVIRIRDTGVGIRPEMLDEIFEPFRQETQDAARGSGGLGLGLALARGLVELHDGSIAATSCGPGAGSEFVVSLPAVAPAAAATPPLAETPELAAPVWRILIVEDHADTATLLQYLLEMHGHRVSLAATAAEGLQILRREPHDAVLCDIGLPGMSGYDFARAVRADPLLATVRLIAASGYGQPDDRARAAEAGFDIHLTKPVTLEGVTEALAQLLATA
jgi:PAS domain S-box-containing protein